MKTGAHTNFDFSERPFLAIWETTRACDLACVHCRASAEPTPAPNELNADDALLLIDQVADAGTPLLVFSGGDCLKRSDLLDLIYHAKSRKLRVGAIPAVTQALTVEKLQAMKDAGLDQVAFSLDSADPAVHDAFRRVSGVFERTLEAVRLANQIGLRTQINSLVNVHNQDSFDSLIALVRDLGIVFWEIFFLVPMGRGQELPLMTGYKFEATFEKIYALSKEVRFVIKVTEAPHYRRFCCEKSRQEGNALAEISKHEMPDAPLRQDSRGGIGRAPSGVNSGKGFLFISSRGDVMPSGFLPLAAGNIKETAVGDIYRDSPIFRLLRDTSFLKGRCGICNYKEMCGGSRARAYALSGDYFAEDPCCVYQPEGNAAALKGAGAL